MLNFLKQIWRSKDLRKRILFTLGLLIVYRLLVQISIPGANLDAIRTIFQQNTFLGVFSALTGGSAENFSIVLMGLSPYINASIIIQLLTVIVPKLEAMSKEGEQGRRTLNRYTRWLTLPLAFLQSYGMIYLLNSQSQIPIIDDIKNPMVILPIMLTITTGTVLLMWLGEVITERGIGNGISLLIFTNIVATMPAIVGQNLFLARQNTENLVPFIIMVILTLALLVFIVMITEGQRKIPITYAGYRTQVRGEQSIIPIRINQAGMIPIIFAVSLVSFPSLLSQFLVNAETGWVRDVAGFLGRTFQQTSISYLVLYALFIIAFTYFYVSITFNPRNVAENIQKRGGYIPGIRPGKQTAEYLGKISNRLNLFGGTFLAFIAVLPIIAQMAFTGSQFGSAPVLISGAGMIIVVGVILELVRQIKSQPIMHDYDKLQ